MKPNKDEIEALTGRKVQSDKDVISEIKELQVKGIKLVAVSLGSEGAMAGCKGRIYKVTPPKVNAVNPVGSGDSFVAGIAVAIERGYSIEEVLRYASACGTANAMEKETGSVQRKVVESLLKDIEVTEVVD
ncbi:MULTISPECIES: PfkB family carbohydrate kinase [Clostridium]|uniref:PfkB family carbohydrate kinase n=1 Tax=Clostridium TaxID=1485 RepID=UPI002906CBFD|nr:PfkB family carbohydrate kinase [Clostridium sp.]